MKDIDIILIGGQSNAVGCTDVVTLDENLRNFVFPNVCLYEEGNFASFYQEKVMKGVKCGMGHNPTQMGIEYGISCRLSEATQKDVGLIRFAYGGTTLFFHWQTEYEGDPTTTIEKGYCYHNFLKTVKNGLQAYKAEGYNPIIRGMVWMQGETDATTKEMATVYELNMRTLFEKLRENIQPDLKIIVGEIATRNENAPYSDEIRRIQKKVVDEDKNCYFLSTKDIPIGHDGFHFDGNQDYALGLRFGEYILKYLELSL
jgi:hypothetical protein